MHDFQYHFIEYAISKGVLCFGEFTLKSGRNSPYFFNTGLFNSGESLARLGDAYAQALRASELQYDMLFGPAYKGIPLVTALSLCLSRDQHRNVPYCFDRKEAKDHGEGGLTVGAPLRGRVVIVDDVISAGTSVRHSIDIINSFDASPVGVIIALDRQERGQGEISAVQETEQLHEIKVISVITLDNIMEYLETRNRTGPELGKIQQYREEYGVK